MSVMNDITTDVIINVDNTPTTTIEVGVQESVKGERGYSAYEVWIMQGNEGSEADFLESLRGDDYMLTDDDKQDIADLVAVSQGEVSKKYVDDQDSATLKTANEYTDAEIDEVYKDANDYTDLKIAEIQTPDVSGQIAEHNESAESHGDIRRSITDTLLAAKEHTDTRLDELDGRKVEKIPGKGLSTNDYTTLEKQQLATITQPTVFEWDGTTYKPISVPADFNKGAYQIVTSVFKQPNPIDNPTVTMYDKVYPLFINDQKPLKDRISNEEICNIWFIKDEARMFALDTNRATIEETLLGIDPNKYITPESLKAATDDVMSNFRVETNASIALAAEEAYEDAIAYADSLVKSYSEPINLYLYPDGIMRTTKPTGEGTSITKTLTTTEQLIAEFNYTIPNDGVVLKDNMYINALFFKSVSSSRATTVRIEYSVGGTVIFNMTTELNNSLPNYELYRQRVNKLSVDTEYTAGTVATYKIYGYVSSGSDSMSLVVGGADTASGLFRNAPIATLSSDKIQYRGQSVMDALDSLFSEIDKVSIMLGNTEDI